MSKVANANVIIAVSAFLLNLVGWLIQHEELVITAMIICSGSILCSLVITVICMCRLRNTEKRTKAYQPKGGGA